MKRFFLGCAAVALLGTASFADQTNLSAGSPATSNTVNVSLTINKWATVTLGAVTNATNSDNGAAGSYDATVATTIVTNTDVTLGLPTLSAASFKDGNNNPLPSGVTVSASTPDLTGTLAPGTHNGSIKVTFGNVPVGSSANTYTGTLTVTIAG